MARQTENRRLLAQQAPVFLPEGQNSHPGSASQLFQGLGHAPAREAPAKLSVFGGEGNGCGPPFKSEPAPGEGIFLKPGLVSPLLCQPHTSPLHRHSPGLLATHSPRKGKELGLF